MILQQIQQELKAPKGQRNSFGNYNYRSCEDILEALKPILAKHGAAIVLADEVMEIGGRVYVKATATLKTKDGNESSTAFAREPQTKKGCDESQITGATSSYARKYALNGLFGIDDTKDADTMDNRAEGQKQAYKPTPKATAKAQRTEEDEQEYQNLLSLYVCKINDCFTMPQLNDCMDSIKAELGGKFAEMRADFVAQYKRREAEIMKATGGLGL